MKEINNGISWRPITKEYLTEYFNIPKEELDGVDIEKFFAEEDAAQGIISYKCMLDENANLKTQPPLNNKSILKSQIYKVQ